jgi:hypothetical protein
MMRMELGDWDDYTYWIRFSKRGKNVSTSWYSGFLSSSIAVSYALMTSLSALRPEIMVPSSLELSLWWISWTTVGHLSGKSFSAILYIMLSKQVLL